MDKISIHELTIETIIGTYDWERKLKQKVVLDIAMDVDIQAAAATDDLRKTIDYAAVAKRVSTFIGESEFLLIETLAEKTALLIKEEFNVAKVHLKVKKLGAIVNAKAVAIAIER